MNKELYDIAKQAMQDAMNEYYDDRCELNDVPDIACDFIKERVETPTKEVRVRPFWIEDNDADLDSALDETIKFCMSHSISDYAIVFDDSQECVLVVYVLNKGGADENA